MISIVFLLAEVTTSECYTYVASKGSPWRIVPTRSNLSPMSPLAILVLVLICGFVWGGFTLFLVRALRSERSRPQDG